MAQQKPAPDAGEVDLSEFLHNPRKVCIFGRLLEGLAEPERRKVEAALAKDKDEIPHARIAEVLGRWGYEMGPQSIGYHRRGKCGCPR